METIKVNMSPNPLDVQTIHASQNDGEARQWGFELHNNGDVIDASEISDQLAFKAYKGGTEQLLPENGSVPTTSPIIADIKYPHGEMTDQEFLYRESPTEEDGLAKITDIKGNTLVWNQLVPPLSAMQGQNGTLSVADNVATVTSSSSTTYLGVSTSGSAIILPESDHRYLMTVEVNPSKALSSCNLSYGSNNVTEYNIPANTWTKISGIVSRSDPTGQFVQFRCFSSFEQGDTMQVRNWNYFDLTAMGLDSLTNAETLKWFADYFPLPYYSYNQGSLLSFNGNGIKTVGANILDLSSEFDRAGVSYTVDDDGWFTVADIAYPSLYRNRFLLPLALTNGSALIEIDTSKTASTNFRMILYNDTIRVATTTTKVENKAFDRISFDWSTTGSTTFRVMVTTMPTIGTYEPYTSSTLSLPISTYFPTGMKSKGDVYDELTETKAITRIGSRAYQSGDESDTSVITDGTTTYYLLATPTETSFTTASLITENAEIPLSNEDGVLIGKCTEQLSENPGFFDAKIKLADADGECYSNKLQLHVERSPQ